MEKPSYRKIFIRVLIFLIYILIGGAIFQLFEKENQQELKARYNTLIKNFMRRYNVSNSDMNRLEQLISESGKQSYSTNWSYANAVFFAGSTVLTVGYGNIVPKTTTGQAFCILYAIFGIPIACLALKSLGERISFMQVSIINSMHTYLFGEGHQIRKIHLKAAILNFIWTSASILLLSALAKMKRPEWTYFECIYFVMITFTTIGFGDYLPMYKDTFSEFDVVTLTLGFFIGFTLVSSLLCAVSNMIEENSKIVIRKARTTIKHHTGRKISKEERSYSMESDITEAAAGGVKGNFSKTNADSKNAQQIIGKNYQKTDN